MDARQFLVDGLILAGTAATAVGDLSAAVQLYDQVVRRDGEHSEPALRSSVALALIHKASVVAQSGRVDEAAELCGEAFARLHDVSSPGMRDRAALALGHRGHWLKVGGRTEEAIASYRQLVESFAEHESASVAEEIRHAREAINSLSAHGSRE